MRRWSFHAVTLASGDAEEEVTAKKELLSSLKADETLTNSKRSSSYRVVDRKELEELVRVTRREEEEVAAAAAQSEKTGEIYEATEVEEGKEEVKKVAITPQLLALAFQQLVSHDKRLFFTNQQTEATDMKPDGGERVKNQSEISQDTEKLSDSVQTPSRVYLLVDYPSSLSEITALLKLGLEIGCATQVTDNPEMVPLLPLIDGVVLLADPLNLSTARGRNRNGSTNLPRNRGGPVVKVDDEGHRLSMMDKSVFQASNAVVKVFYEAAQVGGFEWNDFTFTNVSCSTETSSTKQPEEILKEVFSMLETQAAHKFAFKGWVMSTKFSAIPTFSSDRSDSLYEKYASILSGVFPGNVAVSTVLFGITEAVATASSPLNCSSNPTNVNIKTVPSQFEEFVEHGDLVACRIASAQLYHEVLQANGDPCFVSQGNRRLDDVERTMWRRSDLPGVGNEGRKAMPRLPTISEAERSVRNTELATFYASPRFSCWMVHVTRQLLQIEEELGSCWRGKLQPRAFMENLSRAILPQRIALVLQQNKRDVYLSYYTPTDSLLLTCLPKTPPGRMQSTYWVACDHVRHRPAFKDWKPEEPASREYLTPRTEAAAAAYVPLSAGQLALMAVQTWSLFPADHSVVRVNQTVRGLVWLTVYHHGETFGLRSEMQNIAKYEDNCSKNEAEDLKRSTSSTESGHSVQFVASFQDESTLHISEGKRKLPRKPDKFPTITMTNSFPIGLIVSACSDGSITQRFVQTTTTTKPHNANAAMSKTVLEDDAELEKYRVIYGKGSVLRVFQCGRKEVMLATGYIHVTHHCKKHHHIPREQANYTNKLRPPQVTSLTVDAETHALVERRPNGIIIVTLTSGARVAYHVDGTIMYTNAENTHILVKKRGYADVCIDVEVNMTAQHHAAGERVAVTKGGLRVRSMINVYDGTHVEISYNTRVTAQVNGRVTTWKPNGHIIVAKDSGKVEYRSPQPKQETSDFKDDDDRDLTSHNGVYYFDCRHGCFHLCDNEHNQFHVSLSGREDEPGPTVSVDLAGVVSDKEAARYDVGNIPAKAVINEPIQPHIFILRGDGTGVEILRPHDSTEIMESIDLENQKIETMEGEMPSTQNHSLLRRFNAPGGSSQCQQPLFNDEKLHQEMLRLQRPVPTADKHLPGYFTERERAPAQQQFTVVRRVQQIRPFSTDELNEMHTGWDKWEQWQREREANRECYKVVDPRQPDIIAQEIAMQKKVMAAYKATRARKKLARQKAREIKVKNASQELITGLHMETVQESEETIGGEGEGEDGSDDEFGHFGSDMSDNDVGDTVDVDDPMELLWSAFSQADAEGRGLLSLAQSRLGLVNVLGIGVTTHELTEALIQFKNPYPFDVSFSVFADLVAFFRKGEEDNQDHERPGHDLVNTIPTLNGMAFDQRRRLSMLRAAGSAAEATRATQCSHL